MSSGLKKRNDMLATALVAENGEIHGIYTRCPYCGMVDLRHMNQGIKRSHFLIWDSAGKQNYQCGKCRKYFFTIHLTVPTDMEPMQFYEKINALLQQESAGKAEITEQNNQIPRIPLQIGGTDSRSPYTGAAADPIFEPVDSKAQTQKHISQLQRDDVFLCDCADEPLIALESAILKNTATGDEWTVAACTLSARLLDDDDGDVRHYPASLFADGMVELVSPALCISRHISEVKADDRILYDDHTYTARFDAAMVDTCNGREWNVECIAGDGETQYLYASYFEGGLVNVLVKKESKHA